MCGKDIPKPIYLLRLWKSSDIISLNIIHKQIIFYLFVSPPERFKDNSRIYDLNKIYKRQNYCSVCNLLHMIEFAVVTQNVG